jgi:hypothetical protein
VRANKLYFTHTSGGNSLLHRFVTVFVHSGWKNKFRLRVIRPGRRRESACVGDFQTNEFGNTIFEIHVTDYLARPAARAPGACLAEARAPINQRFVIKKRLRKTTASATGRANKNIKYISLFLSAAGDQSENVPLVYPG